MITGLVCGAFDFCHPGHLILLRECKKQCDFLVVGLHIDPSIENPGKNKPVESLEERVIRLLACRYVDQVSPYSTEDDCRTLKMKMMPDIVFHGADHEGKPSPGDDLGLRDVYIPRNHDYSSGNLIMRLWNTKRHWVGGET